MLNIDYAGAINQMVNPGDAIMSGFKEGLNTTNQLIDIYNDRQQKMADEKARQSLNMLFSNKNPTIEDFNNLIATNPSISDSVKQAIGNASKDVINSNFNTQLSVISAMDNNDFDTAKKQLELQKQSIIDRKDPNNDQLIKAIDAKIKAIDINPVAMRNSMLASLYAYDPKRAGDYLKNKQELVNSNIENESKIAGVQAKIVDQQIERDKLQNSINRLEFEKSKALDEQSAKAIDQQIEEQKLRLGELNYRQDVRKQNFNESELPSPVQTQVLKIGEDIQKAQQSSATLTNAIDEIKSLGYNQQGGLVSATWGGLVNTFPGLDEKRNQYQKIIQQVSVPGAIAVLAGTGAIATKELEMASKTLADNKSTVEQAIFALGRIRAVQDKISSALTFRQSWLEATRGRSTLDKPMTINGVDYGKGDNINEAVTKFLGGSGQSSLYSKYKLGATGATGAW